MLRTSDGGQSWQNVSPPGYGSLQFRDIESIGANTALVLSAGLPAVILKTTDAGHHWKEVYRNENQGVFFDAMDFWDHRNGMAFSDAPANKLLIIETKDGGQSWQKIGDRLLPEVFPQQGGFAASGTCLKTFGDSSVIIGLGGPSSLCLLSHDRGLSWSKGSVPLDSGASSKGIFSFDFFDNRHGLCVGGDYTGDSATTHSAAFTNDGGRTWQRIEKEGISGKYRSCVAYLSIDTLIAVSRTGISYTVDGGLSWQSMAGSFYSISIREGAAWLSGPRGMVAKLFF